MKDIFNEYSGYILFTISIAGLWLSWYQHKKSLKEKKEAINHLRLQFGINQSISKEILSRLRNVANAKNYWDKNIIEGITYRMYEGGLINSLNTSLSDNTLNNLLKEKITISIVLSAQKSLEGQFSALSQINSMLQMIENT